MTESEVEEFHDWLKVGIDKKWVSDLVCATHNGLPNTEAEEREWEEGFDPCVPGMRVWLP
jgi:hypothetical protein